MRKLLLLLCVWCCAMVQAQETTPLEPLSFSEVIKVDSMSAKDLHEAMKRWVATVYKNPDKVTKYDNNGDEMLIHGKYYHSPKGFSSSHYAGYVSYIIQIKFREGRMKVSMYDFIQEGSGSHSETFGIIYNRELTKEEAKERKLIGGLLNPTYTICKNGMESFRESAINKWEDFIKTIRLNIMVIKAQNAEDDW